MAKPEDAELIDLMSRYQQGEMDAFAGLFDVMKAPISRYLWSFVRNQTAVEDLLQETFLQVHRARRSYTPPRPVQPWIYAISRHVALMHLRSGRRRKESVAREELPELPIPPEMESYGDRDTVNRLLTRLPERAREVLMLHHLLGLSFGEVGSILGVSAGTAKVRAHRALKKLRQMVDSKGEQA